MHGRQRDLETDGLVMQHLAPGDRFNTTDPTLDAWRTAIISQGTRLIHTVGDSAPDLP